jgi:type II secretory pathway component PulL
MTDAEKQLQRQLQGLRGLGQSAGFVSLMSRVGSVIAGQPGTRIATINYSDRGGEMRMNILAGDYEAVERVRAEINKAGLSAVMESSSAQGDKVRARLRIGDKS